MDPRELCEKIVVLGQGQCVTHTIDEIDKLQDQIINWINEYER